MERDHQDRAELIDLGTASIETKGPIGPIPDLAGGRMSTSLADD